LRTFRPRSAKNSPHALTGLHLLEMDTWIYPMKAKLKEIFSLELTSSLEDYQPDVLDHFGISVRLMIGPDDSAASESFDILVCTPEWLRTQFDDERCTWGRHMLIVLEYDFKLIRGKIESYVATCHGSNWTEVASKLSRVAAWEFEDYRP
jgi:Immunity protein 8